MIIFFIPPSLFLLLFLSWHPRKVLVLLIQLQITYFPLLTARWGVTPSHTPLLSLLLGFFLGLVQGLQSPLGLGEVLVKLLAHLESSPGLGILRVDGEPLVQVLLGGTPRGHMPTPTTECTGGHQLVLKDLLESRDLCLLLLPKIPVSKLRELLYDWVGVHDRLIVVLIL